MKKNLLIAVIVLMAVAFVSCQKDGVYKPKKKIARISRSWEIDNSLTGKSSAESYTCEEWKWNDKTVESRTRFERKVNLISNEVYFEPTKTTYSYDDKNRIIGAQYDDKKIEYAYNDDKKFSKITVYDGANLESTVELNYEDKVLSSLKIIQYGNTLKSAKALSFVLSSQIVDAICQNEEMSDVEHMQAKDAKITNTDVTLEWDGKNISRIVTKSENYTKTVTYEYDGKLNPYAGLYCGETVSAEMYSKNNVIKSTSNYVRDGYTSDITENVEYEYDGKVPTSIKTTSVTNSNIYGVKYTETKVTTDVYEYTK